jgi:hypothetical protein
MGYIYHIYKHLTPPEILDNIPAFYTFYQPDLSAKSKERGA